MDLVPGVLWIKPTQSITGIILTSQPLLHLAMFQMENVAKQSINLQEFLCIKGFPSQSCWILALCSKYLSTRWRAATVRAVTLGDLSSEGQILYFKKCARLLIIQTCTYRKTWLLRTQSKTPIPTEKLPATSLGLCHVQLHVSPTRNNQVFSSEQLFPFKYCHIVRNDRSRPLLLCLSCRFQWSCCPCGAGVRMVWLLPRIPGTASCGQKLSSWLRRGCAGAECGAEGFASPPGWQRTKGDVSLCAHGLLRQQCVIWHHGSPWLGPYKWRDAKKLQFLMILLGNSRDLFLESGKCLHCKHYIFVGINNSSDQYLIVVNYSID